MLRGKGSVHVVRLACVRAALLAKSGQTWDKGGGAGQHVQVGASILLPGALSTSSQVADKLRELLRENPRKSRAHLRKRTDAEKDADDDDDDVEIIYWSRATPVGLLVAK